MDLDSLIAAELVSDAVADEALFHDLSSSFDASLAKPLSWLASCSWSELLFPSRGFSQYNADVHNIIEPESAFLSKLLAVLERTVLDQLVPNSDDFRFLLKVCRNFSLDLKGFMALSTSLVRAFQEVFRVSEGEAQTLNEALSKLFESFLAYKESPVAALPPPAEDPVIVNGEVKMASFEKLVDILTSGNQIDAVDFLITYRAFSSPLELLNTLINRFNEASKMDAEKQSMIRLKVLSFLKRWIQSFWVDFASDPECPPVSVAFLKKSAMIQSFSAFSNAIVSSVEEHLSKHKTPPASPRQSPRNLGANGIGKGNDLAAVFSAFPIEDIARQLTYDDWVLFKKIEFRELQDTCWTKPSAATASPNVNALVDRFNDLSNWVKCAILTTEKLKPRVNLIKKFILLGIELKALNNYFGVMAVMAALESGSIARLRATFDGVVTTAKYEAMLNELKVLTDVNKNWLNLRECLNALICLKEDRPQNSFPVIPYFGIILADLLFVEEGNSTRVKGLINVSKLVMNAKIIRLVADLQLQKLQHFEPIKEIRKHFKNFRLLTEAQMYEMSKYLEVRAGSEQPPRPTFLSEYEHDDKAEPEKEAKDPKESKRSKKPISRGNSEENPGASRIVRFDGQNGEANRQTAEDSPAPVSKVEPEKLSSGSCKLLSSDEKSFDKTREIDIAEVTEVLMPKNDKSSNFAVITTLGAFYFQARPDAPIAFWEQIFRVLLKTDLVKVTALSDIRALVEYGKAKIAQGASSRSPLVKDKESNPLSPRDSRPTPPYDKNKSRSFPSLPVAPKVEEKPVEKLPQPTSKKPDNVSLLEFTNSNESRPKESASKSRERAAIIDRTASASEFEQPLLSPTHKSRSKKGRAKEGEGATPTMTSTEPTKELNESGEVPSEDPSKALRRISKPNDGSRPRVRAHEPLLDSSSNSNSSRDYSPIPSSIPSEWATYITNLEGIIHSLDSHYVIPSRPQAAEAESRLPDPDDLNSLLEEMGV